MLNLGSTTLIVISLSQLPTIYSVHVSDVAANIVENLSIVSEAVFGLPLADCQDRVYNYARVLCHAASLAIEFTDAR